MANRSTTRGQAAESGSAEPDRDCTRYIASFWFDDPELWFAQFESQTAYSGITDTQKYGLVIAKLDSQTIREVADIVGNPPEKDRYATLKGELIGRLSSSRQEKIRRLLEKEEIGDRSPSKFLRHLKALAGSSTTDEFLGTIWMGPPAPGATPNSNGAESAIREGGSSRRPSLRDSTTGLQRPNGRRGLLIKW